jgi:hypothetical protein
MKPVLNYRPMGNISGSFRSTGVQLVDLGEDKWRVELWDRNAHDKRPFATLELATTDPKAAALAYLFTVFKMRQNELLSVI